MSIAKKLIVLLFFMIITLSNRSESAERMVWVAGKVGDKIITNVDVYDYLALTRLDDTTMAAIFKKANSDINEYNKLTKKYLKGQFNAGLKQMAYFRLVELDATSGKSFKDRKAFRTTEKDYDKQVRELEDKALEKLLDTGKGIRYATKEFGRQLKEMGFPHEANISDTDLYYQWFDLQKKRLKEKIRFEQVRRQEFVASALSNPKFDFNPIDLWDFKSETIDSINELISGKKLSQGEVQSILKSNPQMKIFIDEVEFTSMNSIAMGQNKQKHPEIFKKKMDMLSQELPNIINEELANRILRYNEMAKKLATKYTNSQELEAKAKEAKDLFLNGGTHRELVKSKLYELAAIYKVNGLKNNKEMASVILNALNQTRDQLLEEDTYKDDEYSKSQLEVVAGKLLRQNSNSLSKSALSENDSELISLSVLLLRYEVKKLAYKDKSEVIVKIKDSGDWDAHQQAENFLKQKIFEEGLKKYKEKTLRWDFEGQVQFDLENHESYYGRAAFDFLMK